MSENFEKIMSSVRADNDIVNNNIRGLYGLGGMKASEYGFGDSAKIFKEQTRTLYEEWLRDFLLNRFTYKNAGEQFDGQMLETYLQWLQGVAGITINAAGLPIVVAGTPQGNVVNLRNEATTFTTTTNLYDDLMLSPGNQLKVITRLNPSVGDVVVINNRSNLYINGTTSPMPRTNQNIINYYADELADLKMLARMNRKNMVMPIIGAVNNKNLANQLNEIYASIDNHDRFAVYDSKLGNLSQAMNTTTINQPNLMPQFREEFNNILNEFMTMFGINSIGIDKKERLVKAEANANNQLIENSANIYMTSRKEAIALFNARFNSNIEVEYNDYSESLRDKFGADARSAGIDIGGGGDVDE